MLQKSYKWLEQIDSPAELRNLPEAALLQLADELRDYMIATLSQIGGHFAASLGAVELAIALHYCFDTPSDSLVWDVGHQAYPHKILTGRREAFSTIRKPDGLSGFPKRTESEYDTFGVGHSSTAISAALGMALAAKMQKTGQRSVAIIGDGGMTAGMAFEALNHAGDTDADLLVILNDNEMSISENVGALSNYFTKVLSGKTYNEFRSGSKKVLKRLPQPFANLVKKTENFMKGVLADGTLFEQLGFKYFGPIDGHDLPNLVEVLKNLKTLSGPRLLHVVTTKGKGYQRAEKAPIQYHAVTPFDPEEGMQKKAPGPMTFSQIFGDFLCDLAAEDKRLMAITPAMREGSGMVEFSQSYPEQYIDVAIAEQHSVTLAAGLACGGVKPIVAIYSTFLQRAYDQVVHDVALQNLDVTFAIDRAGIVGADGATHAGIFDLSYLRHIPNMVVMAPSDEEECRNMLYTGYQYQGPAAIRYPRGSGTGKAISTAWRKIPIGQALVVREGQKVAILVFGTLLNEALKVAEDINATVVNMRFVKPLDQKLLSMLAIRHELLVTLEENVIAGGAGSAVGEYLTEIHARTPLLHLGWPDIFPEHGDSKVILREQGLDSIGIRNSIDEACGTFGIKLSPVKRTVEVS